MSVTNQYLIVLTISSDVCLNVPYYRVVIDKAHWEAVLRQLVGKKYFAAKLYFYQENFFLKLNPLEHRSDKELAMQYPH